MKKLFLFLSLLIINYGILFAQEEITITTYYPSPYGSYNDLTANQMKIGGTYSGSGTAFVSNGLIVEGNVGIGTAVPDNKLDVAGVIRGQAITGSGDVLVVGNDTKLVDIDIANTLGLYGLQDGTQAHLKLGSAGPTISGVSGNVGIGTTGPNRRLTIQSSGTRSINSQYLYLRQPDDYGYSFNLDDLTTGRMYLRGVNNGVESDILTLDRSNGNVGIGTTGPGRRLDVNGDFQAADIYTTDGVQIQGLSGRNYFRDAEGVGNLRVGAAWGMPGIYAESGVGVLGGASGASLQNNSLFVTTGGNVGIGTTSPGGKLDVNGTIYQRGAVLHADYVFEPEYKLESIEEHAGYMWKNKHLEAVPKAKKDEEGQDIVEIGSLNRGVLEELEKAHVYIQQLNERVKVLEARLEQKKIGTDTIY